MASRAALALLLLGLLAAPALAVSYIGNGNNPIATVRAWAGL